MTEQDAGHDDDSLSGTQTEMAPSSSETEAQTAWALDDGPEWKPPFWTAGRVVTVVASAAVLAVVAVAGLAGYHLRGTPTPVASPAPTTTNSVTATRPPVEVVPPQTKTVTVEVPAPVDYDQRFIENLRAAGWNVWDTAIARHAHTLCAALRNGDTVQSVNQQMVTVGLLYQHEVGPFTATAMATYPDCP